MLGNNASNIPQLPNPPILPAAPISTGLSKSQILSKWRDEQGRRIFTRENTSDVIKGLNNTPSIDILRDTVNILQGIDGAYFRFEGAANQSEFKLIPTDQRVRHSK